MTTSLLRWVRRPVAGLVPKISDPDKKPMAMVMDGLRATLEDSRPEVLEARLGAIDTEWRGFAYEGVGLGLALFDVLRPRGGSLPAYVAALPDTYAISAYIGAGMALAMLRSRRPEAFLARQDQLVFRWMIMNGYGFFRGFFAQRRFIEQQALVDGLSAYGRRMFDQGLGRAIWFARRGDIAQIIATLAGFPAARLPDLWNGVGFTCAYAGGAAGAQGCEQLWAAAGPQRAQLAVAGALAAQRRLGSGYLPPYTELACQVFCGMPAQDAAQVAQAALADLPDDSLAPQHRSWRERIEAAFAPRIGELGHARAA